MPKKPRVTRSICFTLTDVEISMLYEIVKIENRPSASEALRQIIRQYYKQITGRDMPQKDILKQEEEKDEFDSILLQGR